MATTAAGLLPSRLFYVNDRSTGLRFLVDTGAEVSVVLLHHLNVYIDETISAFKQQTIPK